METLFHARDLVSGPKLAIIPNCNGYQVRCEAQNPGSKSEKYYSDLFELATAIRKGYSAL